VSYFPATSEALAQQIVTITITITVDIHIIIIVVPIMAIIIIIVILIWLVCQVLYNLLQSLHLRCRLLLWTPGKGGVAGAVTFGEIHAECNARLTGATAFSRKCWGKQEGIPRPFPLNRTIMIIVRVRVCVGV